MKLIFTLFIYFAGFTGPLIGVAQAEPSQDRLVFSEARIVAPIKGTNVTAAYAVVKNTSNDSVTLAISSVDPFKAVEMHETFVADGKTGMRKIEYVKLSGHQTFEFKPGGNHIMLFDPTRVVSAGEKLKVNFLVNEKVFSVPFKVAVRDNQIEEHTHHALPSCSYVLNSNSVKVNWTAFKTTKRVGVSGTFRKVTVAGATKSKTLETLVTGLKVKVDRTSIDTGTPARDQTLTQFFFNQLKGTEITGTVTRVSETEKTLVLNLSMNGQKRNVPMTFTQENNTLTAKGQINILDFKAESALSSLHEKCVDLHRGEDGVSKTWPDVEISLSGDVESDCR